MPLVIQFNTSGSLNDAVNYRAASLLSLVS